MKKIFFTLLSFLLLFSCTRDQAVETVAEDFLSAYLDCRFTEASKWASPRMQEQIKWRASNMTQAEMELLTEGSVASEVIAESSWHESDTEAIVELTAEDALLVDSIGLPGYMGNARFRITLERPKKRGKWMVAAIQRLDCSNNE